jgi:ribonuclease P protein component
VFTKGRKVSCKGAALFTLANGLALHRVAFCFARKFGPAVRRNRARRLGREAYRALRPRLTGARRCDIVLLLYPGTDTLADRAAQLEALLGRAGLL